MTENQPYQSQRSRGRPGYGARKAITVRLPQQDMERLTKAAEESGYSTVPMFITALVYEQMDRPLPRWAAPSNVAAS